MLGLAVLGTCLALGQSTTFVEEVYARSVSPTLCHFLAGATGWLPFSVADLCLVGLAAGALTLTLRGIWRLARKRASVGAAARAGGLRTLQWTVLVAAAFYAVWGLNYQRRPLPERLGWPVAVPPADRTAQAEELEALCLAATAATNAAYREAFGTDDLGVPSTWHGERAELDRAVDIGLDAAGAELGLERAYSGARGPAKRTLLAPLMTRLHLSGFFFPWTGEANVNDEPPPCDVAHVLAHEKAHQRGIAFEDEAEFLGYLAGTRAPHAYARYAAHLFAHRIYLNEIARIAPQRVEELRAMRSPGVARDVAASTTFWSRSQTKLVVIARTVNDTYLKTQGVQSGVQSYGAAADLLVRYARLAGGGAGAK